MEENKINLIKTGMMILRLSVKLCFSRASGYRALSRKLEPGVLS